VRSKLVPESLAERVALWAGKVPVPIVDTIFPLLKARALMAAERLGIFEVLRDAPLSPSGLAAELGLDQESLSLLLRVLVASGYLAERAGRYQLSHLARKTLLRGSPLDSRGFLRFNYTQWRLVEHLERLLQTGQSLDLHQRMSGSQDWENYQRAMLEIARSHAPILARRVPVRRGARLLVDVAGSHGLLGAAICRRHVALRSRMLELPLALLSASPRKSASTTWWSTSPGICARTSSARARTSSCLATSCITSPRRRTWTCCAVPIEP
jgi:DNA-binding transcriptional ArsR family regulator